MSHRFDDTLLQHGLPPLRRRAVTTLQVNLGKLCNQACRHCHVDAGPTRTEQMSGETVAQVLRLLERNPRVERVDITGGAPELNPHFRPLIDGALAHGREVMVRCNLTVLHEPGQVDTAAYYAERGVHVIASLPCYTSENVDAQRGGGVFELSIRALLALNELGYGAAEGGPSDDALRLDLVYNPLGPSLPPEQGALERDYRERLRVDFGLRFDRLFALANLPVHRFADDLRRADNFESYEQLLAEAFNGAAVNDLMCRDLLSVDWDGGLAECDFHQMLDLPLGAGPRHVAELDDLSALLDAPITTASHCLGCTAGQGSSCGGALADVATHAD